MIPITPQAEPLGFENNVRRKGRAFLLKKRCFDASLPLNAVYPNEQCPKKIEGQWNACWTECLDDLHNAYGSICAYLGIKITVGHVDHFLPKSIYYGLAYEWSNYRLSSETVNIQKGAKLDIYDPFEMPPDVFFLDIMGDTFQLIPNPNLRDTQIGKAEHTIEVLNLNNSHYCRMRRGRFLSYIKHHVTAEHMQQTAPYIWSEIKRQNLEV